MYNQEFFENKYTQSPKNFYNFIVELLKSIALRYNNQTKVFTNKDKKYVNDLQTIKFLYKFFEARTNNRNYSFEKDYNQIIKIIEDLSLYLTLLQEADNLRHDMLNGDSILERIQKLEQSSF